ncbi:pyruvate dehydrogenase E2 component (dihydrolipoamide acetyltransferase) [Nitrosomonas eutropha]|uniref:Acetyltransferase component of pyruvate dehydrogenase complex n=1 Tax=Nitrosomonas eutropha TaxID=916 RepID=A0A1I7GKC7_9PROT|nr:dihydrolipoyllysine-residue acetyltransferase [Nitrosomonas eutropha]SFU48884.1 pyruvate dehydrogenase E2 component (dihydrolipoamide acetyltransferase) [Nitrosomonas eutropha]
MAEVKKVLVPDIGSFEDIPVIEIMVKPGDNVQAEDPLIVLESDKATVEVPSPYSGTIREIILQIGAKVSKDSEILTMEVISVAKDEEKTPESQPSGSPSEPQPVQTGMAKLNQPEATPVVKSASTTAAKPVAPPSLLPKLDQEVGQHGKIIPHASPSVRRFSRELGVDLNRVVGTGPKLRILKEDVQAFVKQVLAGEHSTGSSLNLLPWPHVDFAKFGPIELKSLSRIRQISGANLHRNWAMIPHVTQFDEADITDLEALRKTHNETRKNDGTKLTILAFLIKAVTAALKKFPEFNASLDNSTAESQLIIKHYYHLGFAVDTPNGLVVPVIRDADQKGVISIAKELARLSSLAREGKLMPNDMQGASFTISSLGGIGGTGFTPIINAPEVAILGISRASLQPVYQNEKFVPRLMLPLSLSYDHRVVDGAAAARFTAHLASILTDMRLALF